NTPSPGPPAHTWRMRVGLRCAPVGGRRPGTPNRKYRLPGGGHGEDPRRSRGDAAGAKLGADPVERACGERGSRPVSPSSRAASTGTGRHVVGCGHRAGRRPRSSRGRDDPSGRSGEPATGRRGPGGQQRGGWRSRRPLVNTGEPELARGGAERRGREIQAKLPQWASDDSHRRFDDLFNLVTDPAFLLVAWDRVRGNKGARTAGVDGQTAYYVETVRGVEMVLDELRSRLKDRSFRPPPVRERMIPKANGQTRRLGIATVTDRVVQASLKLVLEPIFEADFLPCSYGFRPGRRAQDAVAEVRHFTARSYEWIVEGDIEACFDEISHAALMGRVRERIGDKRVLALVKAFLKAGILTEGGLVIATQTGTPQGGILSPVLANGALSTLDGTVAGKPGGPGSTDTQRSRRRRRGAANYRLVRYADDFVVMVAGHQQHAAALVSEIAACVGH